MADDVQVAVRVVTTILLMAYVPFSAASVSEKPDPSRMRLVFRSPVDP